MNNRLLLTKRDLAMKSDYIAGTKKNQQSDPEMGVNVY